MPVTGAGMTPERGNSTRQKPGWLGTAGASTLRNFAPAERACGEMTVRVRGHASDMQVHQW